jgi:hypothetical protein
MLASLRYMDTFVKMEGTWLFAERLLYVDWMEGARTLMTSTESAPAQGSLSKNR